MLLLERLALHLLSLHQFKATQVESVALPQQITQVAAAVEQQPLEPQESRRLAV